MILIMAFGMRIVVNRTKPDRYRRSRFFRIIITIIMRTTCVFMDLCQMLDDARWCLQQAGGSFTLTTSSTMMMRCLLNSDGMIVLLCHPTRVTGNYADEMELPASTTEANTTKL